MNETQNRATRNDYLLLVLLLGLGAINLIDRNLIVSLSNFIVPDLGLSNTQFGLLTGFVFIAFYAVMGLFMGFLADRMNRIHIIAAALTLWSILTAVSGAARGFVSLAVPRAFIGVGESALTPSALSLLADRFPSSKLGFVSSVYNFALPIGIGLSFIIAGALAPLIGWRGCFYLLGAIGLVTMPLLFFFKDPRTNADTTPGESASANFSLKTAAKNILAALKTSRPLRLVILGAMLIALHYGVLAFDQLWLVQERGFERAEIAGITGWFAMVFGIVGTLHGAFLMDYCYSKFSIPRERFIFFTCLALFPFLIVYRLAEGNSLMFWIGYSSVYLFSAATTGPLFAAVQANSPSHMRATMIAFKMLCASFFGIGVGSLLIGIAIDWTTALGYSNPYTWVLLSVTVFSSAGLLAFYVAGSEQQK